MSSMEKQYAATMKTVFWIASILSVLLLAIYIVSSTHVTHYDTNDLGLLTKLPITFWIGLSCLGVLLYVSRKSERRTVIVVALISLYLFGIPTLIRENKAEWLLHSYYRSSQSVYLLSEGHIALHTIYPLDAWNWPGFFYFTAFISSSTGIPAPVLCDYFPLLTIALFGVITYSILRLRLNNLYSSFGALWFIGSFYTSQHYFSPQSIAYLVYFTIFLLLVKLFFIKNKQSIAFPLSIIFMFTAIVVTHLLTSFMVLVGVFAIYSSCKISKVETHPFYSIFTCILLASIFFSYQFLVIPKNLSAIIKILYEEIFIQQETHLSAIIKTRIIGSTSYLLELVGTYSITIINVVIAIFAILKTALDLFRHKKGIKRDLFWIAWIISAGIFAVSMKYGTYEAIERAFMFMLLPASYFSIKFLKKKPRILILAITILIFIHIPADYCNEMWTMVPTTELKGTDFYTKNVPPTEPFLYEGFYYTLIYRGTQISITGFPPFYSLPSYEFVNETIGEAGFIISSKLQENCYQYFLGVDPLENFNFDNHRNQIYNNERFFIYAKNSIN